MKKLIKNTLIYGIGSVLVKSISFITLPLFTRYLTPEDYGVIGILMFFSSFLYPVLTLGFGTSIGVVYFEKKDYKYYNEVINSSFTVLFIVGFCFFLISIFLIKIICIILLKTEKYWIETLYLIVGTIFSIIYMPFILNLQFQEKSLKFVLYSFIVSFLTAAINIYLIVFLKRGVKGYFENYAFMQFFAFLLYSFFGDNIRLKFFLKKEIVLSLLKYGLPMIPSFFSLFILSQSSRYILNLVGNLDMVGIFTIAYNISITIKIITDSFMQAWVPYFLSFNDKQDEAFEHFGKITKYYIIIIGLIVLCYFLYSKFVVMLLLNYKFFNSYRLIGFLTLGNFFLALFHLYLPPMYFEKEVKYSSIIQAISAFISIFLNFIFIKLFLDIGASISYSLGFLIMCVLTWIYNSMFSKSKLKNFKFDKKIFIIVFIYFIFICISFIPREFNLMKEFIYSNLLLIFCLLFVLLILNKDEKKEMIDYIKIFKK